MAWLKAVLPVAISSTRIGRRWDEVGEAEDMFTVYAMHLLEQAISLDAVERLKIRISTLKKLEAF